MAHSMFGAARKAALLCVIALAPACTHDEILTPDPSDNGAEYGIQFLTQHTLPRVGMEALFQGRIYRDEQGCLRLDVLGDDPSPVWPYGFSLASRAGELLVLDHAGRTIGRVGGEFRFGGGGKDELDRLAPYVSPQTLAEAARCPGGYWLVGATTPGS